MVTIRSHLHHIASDSISGTENILNKTFEFMIYFHFFFYHISFFSSFLFPNFPTQKDLTLLFGQTLVL